MAIKETSTDKMLKERVNRTERRTISVLLFNLLLLISATSRNEQVRIMLLFKRPPETLVGRETDATAAGETPRPRCAILELFFEMDTSAKRVFMLSGFEEDEQATLAKIIARLGGEFINHHSFSLRCTHFISKSFKPTEKVLSAIASGKWMLTVTYLHESSAKEAWEEEETFEWSPNMSFSKAPSINVLKRLEAPKRCRLEVLNSGRGIFSGWSVMLYLEKKKTSIVKALVAGGASVKKAMAIGHLSQVEKLKGVVTHIISEQPYPFADLIVKEFQRCGIQVVDFTFIEQFIFHRPSGAGGEIKVESEFSNTETSSCENLGVSNNAACGMNVDDIKQSGDSSSALLVMSGIDELITKMMTPKVITRRKRKALDVGDDQGSFSKQQKNVTVKSEFPGEVAVAAEAPLASNYTYWPLRLQNKNVETIDQAPNTATKDISQRLSSVAEHNTRDLTMAVNENLPAFSKPTIATLSLLQKIFRYEPDEETMYLWPQVTEVIANVITEVFPLFTRKNIYDLLTFDQDKPRKFLKSLYSSVVGQPGKFAYMKLISTFLKEDFEQFLHVTINMKDVLQSADPESTPLLYTMFRTDTSSPETQTTLLMSLLKQAITENNVKLHIEIVTLVQIVAEMDRLNSTEFSWPVPVVEGSSIAEKLFNLTQKLEMDQTKSLLTSMVYVNWLQLDVVLRLLNDFLHTDVSMQELTIMKIASVFVLGQLSSYTKAPVKRNKVGETTLHQLCRQNKLEKLKEYLEEADADCNVQDNAGNSPLHECCFKGRFENIRELLRWSAQKNVPIYPTLQVFQCGTTALHEAIASCNVECASLLIGYGGTNMLDMQNKAGKTPRDLIVSGSKMHQEIQSISSTTKEYMCLHRFASKVSADYYVFLLNIFVNAYVNTSRLKMFDQKGDLKCLFKGTFTREPVPCELQKLRQDVDSFPVIYESISAFNEKLAKGKLTSIESKEEIQTMLNLFS